MLDFIRTIVAFAVVLGILVSVHEFGHYVAARLCGVHVEAFSIGFGRALATWRDRAGTEWRLSLLPLGGFVKLHGQIPIELASPEDRAHWLPGRTFQEKPLGSRAIIVAAGPIANFVLAVVLFLGLFGVAGRPVVQPIVNGVIAESPAAAAGLKPGDRIIAVGRSPVKSFTDIQRLVEARPDQPLALTIVRDGHTLQVLVHAGATMRAGRRVGELGVSGQTTAYVRLGPFAALTAAASESWNVTVATVDGVWQIISTRRGSADLGGPIRIAELSGRVAALGIASLVSFIAILSINLGLLNLLPIPVLDGGHLLFYLAEAVLRRPLSARVQELGLRAGIALLVFIFVFATWNDLMHLGVVQWVRNL
ncbi:MAG: RIP metalloprotease RseP [Acetobacteraceae bacterium]